MSLHPKRRQGRTTDEATEAVGALLGLGLVAAPAGAAQQLTTRPYVALGLSAAFSLGAMWIGLTASYLAPRVPPSFAIIAVTSLTYLCATVWTSATRGRPARLPRAARRAATEVGSGR